MLVSMALASCATTLAMEPIPIKDEKLVYHSGSPALVETTPTCMVAVVAPSMPFKPNHGRAYVYVYFKNLGKQEQNFSSGNLRIHEANGNPLAVYSYRALVEEEFPKAESNPFAAALNDDSRSVAANQDGDPYSFGTASASGPERFATGTDGGITYNAAVAQQALLQAYAANQGDKAKAQLKHILELGLLSKNYLKAQSVGPGVTYGGLVAFDIPKHPEGAIVDIDVSTNSGIASFRIKLQKAQ